jgi:transposase-like protein
MVQCPECGSTNISKNGKRQGKQNHICNLCRRQFIEHPSPRSGYPEDLKRECLKMYVNITSLFSPITPEDVMLFQVSRNAGSFDSAVNSLPQV